MTERVTEQRRQLERRMLAMTMFKFMLFAERLGEDVSRLPSPPPCPLWLWSLSNPWWLFQYAVAKLRIGRPWLWGIESAEQKLDSSR